MKHLGRQFVLNDYLNQLNIDGERLTNRFWLVAHTKWGKELVGSVTPIGNTNIFTSLDGNVYTSLDKLLIAFADTYFGNEVLNTSSALNGRSHFALFKSFRVYDKVEILESGVLLSDIPGMSEEV